MGDGLASHDSEAISSSSSSSSIIDQSGVDPGPGPGPGAGRDGAAPTTGVHHQSIRIQEPLERRPLLAQRAAFAHNLDGDVYSCYSYGGTSSSNHPPNPNSSNAAHRGLPVYTTIHRIRRDIISVVEDYLSLDQLRDVRLNVSVIRPLVDKLYEQDDISIVYCLLVNRAQFLSEQAHLSNRQNVNFTRGMLCELIATRILRRFNEDNDGDGGARNMLVLAHILIAGFEPFQNAPDVIRDEVGASTAHHRTLPALEVAILSESRIFLASTSCQKIVDAIYEGRVIYTPSSFMDIIPDRYKQRPISLYNPRAAPLLNHYRLVVPRTRNYLEIMHFVLLLALYLAFMSERDARRVTNLEIVFTVYALGWVLDQFATLLEHGWDVYAQNLWSFLDVTFAVIYWVYLAIRIYSWGTGSFEAGQQALDVLAIGAPVLIPRLAFNLLSDNLVFLSLRSMMSDFALLSALAAWCFLGFLLSLIWLGNGNFGAATISKWMIYIWFGLDGSGIQHSTDFHKILGPSLMVTFAFLGNTLFLTILVSMLSTTFGHIVNNAPAEIQFRRAVMTLEGVKGDAIFAYPPPFNILAILLLVPLKFCVSPRWFHKIHVLSVRLINLPILLIIAIAERRSLSPLSPHNNNSLPPLSPAPSLSKSHHHHPALKIRRRFWERWRITTHSDISTVFEVPLPDSVLDEIAGDDDMTRHLIRRQFATAATGAVRGGGGGPSGEQQQQQQLQPMVASASPVGLAKPGPGPGGPRVVGRRDSIAPFPGLRAELRGVLSESDEVTDITARLETLEESLERIEGLLERLVNNSAGGGGSNSSSGGGGGDGSEEGGGGRVQILGRRKSLSLAELNREAEEE
ncbi:calcium channel YVC1 [Chaetomidium leptoderma]|uniref:Calcium channel YVC1 n=1 Tax=Chaetomidium leptoderma TaxID=669021 RepID=A0AAN6VNT4_9PEZI|nr:calcium channel YVC1 [Chaetomidium leptoderma]